MTHSRKRWSLCFHSRVWAVTALILGLSRVEHMGLFLKQLISPGGFSFLFPARYHMRSALRLTQRPPLCENSKPHGDATEERQQPRNTELPGTWVKKPLEVDSPASPAPKCPHKQRNCTTEPFPNSQIHQICFHEAKIVVLSDQGVLVVYYTCT